MLTEALIGVIMVVQGISSLNLRSTIYPKRNVANNSQIPFEANNNNIYIQKRHKRSQKDRIIKLLAMLAVLVVGGLLLESYLVRNGKGSIFEHADTDNYDFIPIYITDDLT